jgi:hypothetical protein
LISPDRAGPDADPKAVPVEKRRSAWQPLTPGGVAAFAQAPLKHLLIVQVLVALFIATTLSWLLFSVWFPTIASAINVLPENGRITSGRLQWQGPTVTTLAESPFLAITVDLNHAGTARSPAHFQLEFAAFDCRLYSLFGFVTIEYPHDRHIPFNRPALVPWWGAWAAWFLGGAAVATLISLLLVWAILATGYALPAWLIAFFADRCLTLTGSWRLSGAVLMPGALLMGGSMIAYGRGMLRPIDLLALSAAHILMGWIYLCVTPFFCPPRSKSSPTSNPFSPSSKPSSA